MRIWLIIPFQVEFTFIRLQFNQWLVWLFLMEKKYSPSDYLLPRRLTYKELDHQVLPIKYRNRCLSWRVDPLPLDLPLAGTFRWRRHFCRSNSTFRSTGHCEWCALVSEPLVMNHVDGGHKSVESVDMGVEPKIGGKTPNHPLKNRVFLYFHHPFWGTTILYKPSILGAFPLFSVQHPYGYYPLVRQGGIIRPVTRFVGIQRVLGTIQTGDFYTTNGVNEDVGDVKYTAKCRRFHIFNRKINNIWILQIGTTFSKIKIG